MIKYIFYEDYKAGETRETLEREITQTDIIIHAGQTGNFSPYHMDKEWCKNTKFKQRTLHETLVLSIAIGMTKNIINPAEFSLGYNNLKFLRPVFIGDIITAFITVLEKKDHQEIENKGIIIKKIEVKNQDDEIVMECEYIVLCNRKFRK